MNQRLSLRAASRVEARLQVLGAGHAPMPCAVEFMAGGRVRASAAHPVSAGAPVMLEMQERWLTSEVVSCRPMLEGYALSLHLHGDGGSGRGEGI